MEPIPRRTFNIETETGARGAKEESNELLNTEETAIKQKKEKCIEIFRNCTEIREIIVSSTHNPQHLEIGSIMDMLYKDQHFLNCK